MVYEVKWSKSFQALDKWWFPGVYKISQNEWSVVSAHCVIRRSSARPMAVPQILVNILLTSWRTAPMPFKETKILQNFWKWSWVPNDLQTMAQDVSFAVPKAFVSSKYGLAPCHNGTDPTLRLNISGNHLKILSKNFWGTFTPYQYLN